MTRQGGASAFDGTAVAYELGRPEYPDEALDWWDERGAFEPGFAVLDLAAGTGKLTRALPVHVCEVVAVEPLANMREQFAIAIPDVQIVDGTAEEIPFPDESFDTVVVGQAFHWFDQRRALDEIARVLRPGGGLGLIWNEDDPTRASWMAGLIEARRSIADSPTKPSSASAGQSTGSVIEANAHFGSVEQKDFVWAEPSTVERILANVLSRSYVSSLPSDERLAVLTSVRTAIEPLGEPIDYPYETTVFWAPLETSTTEESTVVSTAR